MKRGTQLIIDERDRQIAKGFTLRHDSTHCNGELLDAAECYIKAADACRFGGNNITYNGGYRIGEGVPQAWPWEPSWWKPSNDPVRNLEKAGALIAAEIDRLVDKECDHSFSTLGGKCNKCGISNRELILGPTETDPSPEEITKIASKIVKEAEEKNAVQAHYTHDEVVPQGETCGYCGSMSPLDALTLLKTPGTRFECADWKYGWPHKYYLENEQALPGKRKFYCVHLEQLTPLELEEFSKLSFASVRIAWTKHPEKGLGYLCQGKRFGIIDADGKPNFDRMA